jgi:hypothetical protein
MTNSVKQMMTRVPGNGTRSFVVEVEFIGCTQPESSGGRHHGSAITYVFQKKRREVRTDKLDARHHAQPATLSWPTSPTPNHHNMDTPQILLDALNKSITSGKFVDTKIYVFSRREASGRVSSPQSLYCNGHVLNTIPYFSTRE